MISLASIAAFLGSILGRFVVGGVMLAGLWVAFAVHYEGKGEAKAVARIERAGAANAKKADAARRAVDKLPDGSLFDVHFRDR